MQNVVTDSLSLSLFNCIESILDAGERYDLLHHVAKRALFDAARREQRKRRSNHLISLPTQFNDNKGHIVS
jgi:hypothetical protein